MMNALEARRQRRTLQVAAAFLVGFGIALGPLVTGSGWWYLGRTSEAFAWHTRAAAYYERAADAYQSNGRVFTDDEGRIRFKVSARGFRNYDETQALFRAGLSHKRAGALDRAVIVLGEASERALVEGYPQSDINLILAERLEAIVLLESE
jgi:hypothetical protein